MDVAFSVAELAAIAAPKLTKGLTGRTIQGIAALAEAIPGDLSFLSNARYRPDVAQTRASLVLLPLDYQGEPAADQVFFLTENPSVALARICSRLEQQLWPRPSSGVHPTAIVAASAKIAGTATVGPFCLVEEGAVLGDRVHLQAQVHIGRNVVVGSDSWIMPGVVVMAECDIGQRVRLHPGVVIGSDGFGYEFVKGRHEKIPQVGRVSLGDDVEIGANTTIDRARFGRTSVGEGTKIDNLVQVAHNVRIGRHCILCAQTGISGSTSLGDYVVLGGKAGLAGHISIGAGAKVGGGAGVTSDVAPGGFVNGNPAIPYMLERRVAVLKQRLPDLFRRVAALEEQFEKVKKLPPDALVDKLPQP